MKGIKGRFLKRFRSIPSIYTPKQNNAVPLQDESQEKLPDYQNLPNYDIQEEHRTITNLEDMESRLCLGRKNGHVLSADQLASAKEIDIFEECECGFDSMPGMDDSSSSTSSPISMLSDSDEEAIHSKFRAQDLLEFEENCPPGGSDKVILYTTSLRGIRKTYEDCQAIKFLLESFRVVYFERDVSMHHVFRDELWGILGGTRTIPPRLFIKGRHIGGANEVITLHEVGKLKKLLEGIPVVGSASNLHCSWCGGVRFLLCSDCNGSCKIYKGDDERNGGINLFGRCPKCNENGLVKCPTCSC